MSRRRTSERAPRERRQDHLERRAAPGRRVEEARNPGRPSAKLLIFCWLKQMMPDASAAS